MTSWNPYITEYEFAAMTNQFITSDIKWKVAFLIIDLIFCIIAL